MVSIARVVVDFVGNPAKLIAEAEASGKAAGEAAGKSFNAGMVAVGLGVTAVAGLVALTEKTTAWANSIYILSKQTGLSAETLTAWQYAAAKVGVDGDAMSAMFSRFAVNVAKANSPIVNLGVAVKDAQGNFLPMDAILNAVADKFASMPDGIQKSADAVATFGKQGRAMIPFLDEGSRGIAAMTEEATRLGVVLTDQNVEEFHKLALAQHELDQSAKGLGVSLSEALVPVMLALVKAANAGAPVLKTIGDNAGLIVPIIEALAVTVGVKLTASFVTAALSATGFGGATTAAAAVATTSGDTIATAGRTAAAGWSGALGILLLAKTLGDQLAGQSHLVADTEALISQTNALLATYRAGGETVGAFGEKLKALEASFDPKVIAYARQESAGFIEIEKFAGVATDDLTVKLGNQADTVVTLAGELEKLRKAAADRIITDQAQTQVTIDQDVANRDAVDALHEFGVQQGEVIDHTASLKHQLDLLMGGMYGVSNAAGPMGTALGVVDGELDTLTTKAWLAYNAVTQLALAQGGAGAGAVSSAQATALGFGGVETTASFNLNPKMPRVAAAPVSAATKALVATVGTDLTAALQKATATADTLFASMRDKSIATATTIHTNQLRAITDEKNLAYAIAERTANDQKAALAAEKAAFFTQANADAAAFALKQTGEQKTALEQAVTDASTALAQNTDPTQVDQLTRSYNAAVLALQDFNEQQRIAAEQADAQKKADALDAANQTIDPVTHAPITKIDLALQQAKSDADKIAKQKTDQANADLAEAKKDASDLYNQQKGDFNNALALVVKHLKDVKGVHSDANAEITALYKKWGIDQNAASKSAGAAITLALAEGLKSEVHAVETAAETLANAVRKYIKVGSPAEVGPLHDNPPDVMGRILGWQIGQGVVAGFAATLPDYKAVLDAFVALGYGPNQAAWSAAAVVGAAGGAPAKTPGTFYDTNGVEITNPQQIAALSGQFYDATGADPGTHNPFYHLPQAAPSYGMWTQPTPAAGDKSYHVTVNNPKPERASDTLDRLRVLGRTGQLPS